jgi:osmotically-inducible protein OsmY
MPYIQRYTRLFLITAISSACLSTAHAETSHEALDDTQAKISEAAESAANTASKFAGDAQEAFKLGLKEGKIESLLFFNKHLNGYKLDAQIQGNQVILSGQVAQDIEKEYAEQLTLSIKGVNSVTNNIVVDHNEQKTALGTTTNKISSTFKDASITASIKAKLLANSHVSGMKVNVDTTNKEVFLRGEAQSMLEKDLIEQIASNTPGVQRVVNEIQVLLN